MAFLQNTRQAIRTVASDVEYSSAGRSIYPLPRTGLLSRIHLHFSGTMALDKGDTGTLTLGSYGPFALLNRIKLIANQGTSIIDLTGYGAHILDIISNAKGWEPDDGQVSAGFASTLYNAPVEDGNNTWEWGLTLNVTPNDRDSIGLILLQTDQMAAELQFEWNAAGGSTADYAVKLTGDATASYTGTVKITLETFTIPAGSQDKPDVSTIFQQLERQDGIANTGPNTISLLRSDVYARIVHLVQIAGAPNYDDVDRLRIMYNSTDTPYDLTRQPQLDLQRRRYGRDLPTGVFVHDLAYQGIPGYGGQRDLVNAQSVSEFASIIDVASDASPSATNSWIRTVTQRFVRVSVPGAVR